MQRRDLRVGASVIGVSLILLVLVRPERGPVADVASAALPAGRAVVLESVRAQPSQGELRLSGTVEARASAELRFDVAGRVARFLVEEGERVAEGEPIAALDLQDLERDSELARAARDRARAVAEAARAVRGRAEALHAKHRISDQQLEDSQFETRAAEARLREAELRVEGADRRLSKGTLRAPMSGYVARHLVELHEYVEAGQNAVKLIDLETVHVRAAAPDVRSSLVERSGSAIVRSAARPGVEFEGRIVQIDLVADPDTRSWPFEVAVANPNLWLRPQAVVDVILAGGGGEAQMSLPLAAVLRDSQEGPFCFVAVREAETQKASAAQRMGPATKASERTRGENAALVAVRRSLVVGRAVGDRIVIEAGLEPGEQVVVEGQHFIAAGDPLVPVNH